MKKPLNNSDRPDLKHLFSHDATAPKVISKAGVRAKNALKTLDPKDPVAGKTTAANQGKSGATAPKSSSRSKTSRHTAEINEMEFLVSHDTDGSTKSGISTHVRVHVVLLLLGLVGSLACWWIMVNTAQGEEVASNLGLQGVANSLENVLSLLAYPVLMFAIILTAYSVQQLYLAYRRANYLESSKRRK